ALPIGERSGQGRDGIGVAGGERGPLDDGDGLLGEEQEAVDGGRQRLLGDPAATGHLARVALRVRLCEGGGDRVQGRQGLVPAVGDERGGIGRAGPLGQVDRKSGV